MNRLQPEVAMLRCSCFLLIMCLSTLVLAQDDGALRREVLAAENDRRDAILKGDKATLDRLLSEDYKVVVMTGAVADKLAELTLYTGDRRTESWSADEMDIRIYGDIAVVIGRATVKDVLRGQSRNFRFRFTHVWVKRNGGWQVVSRQATELK